MKLFINGIVSGTSTNSISLAPTGSIYIGRYQPSATQYFSGYITNLRVVKGQALYTANFITSTTPLTTTSQGATAGNVSLLTSQSIRFVDNSTNAFTITTAGTPKVATQNPFQLNTGVSYYFDGTGDYLALTNSNALNNLAGNFTVEGWFYASASISGGASLVNFGTEAANRWSPFVNASYQLAYNVYGVGSTIFTGAAAVLNTWNHFAYVRSGSTITGYLNGTSVGTGTLSGTLGNGQIFVGVDGARTGSYWTGYLTDIRVTYGYARYSGNFTPPTAALFLK
jgi:hypothetical protein